ncbi:MAG: GTP 3',8-cyclase MoaA [Desulfuromonas sp.]|nr:MAG: GTP 3',8-cyclase MoaA [Desulfuromonas sp.]
MGFHPNGPETSLQDRFGRTIEYLRLSVTDRCNLRCLYCMPDEGVDSIGHNRVMSYEEMGRVAAAAVRLGVRKIRVTGGEPLVRRGLVNFIRTLADLPGSPEVVLTTNGLLLAEHAGALKAAGLSRVNVSLDTLHEERFKRITRRDGLIQVLAGLEAAKDVGLTPIKVNMVPIRGFNEDEIADFARLTLNRRCDVRFIEFMPVRDDLGFNADQRISEDEILDQLEKVGELLSVENSNGALDGPARMYRYPDGQGQIGIITAVSRHFCGSCNRLRLTADGRLRPCLMSDDEIDLLAGLRSDAFSAARIEELLLEAANAKPAGHHLEAGEKPLRCRTMKDIGG